MQRQQALEERPGRERPETSGGGLRQLLMHRLHCVEHAFGWLDFPVQVQHTFPWHEPSSLQVELAVAGIHTCAQPEQKVAKRVVLAQMPLELLEQMLAESRPDSVIEVCLDCAEEYIREAVVFHDETLTPEPAVAEIEDAGDRRARGLPNAVLLRVGGHRDEVGVAAPARAE